RSFYRPCSGRAGRRQRRWSARRDRPGHHQWQETDTHFPHLRGADVSFFRKGETNMVFSKILNRSNETGMSSARGRRASVRPRKLLPRLEALEDRLVPAVFNVTSLLDSNVAGSGSLRRAITDSNATAGLNQINILTPGKYRLILNGADDNNTAGDLDILTND